MVTYLLLIRNHPLAAHGMLASGTAGATHQRGIVEKYGGEVRAQFALAGHYDAMLLVDMPSEAACRAMVLSAAASGQQVDDLKAFAPEELDAAAEVVRSIGEDQAAGEI